MHVGVKQVLLRSKGQQKGEGLPPSAPCGVVYGQVSALRSVDLSTDSRLCRADTPICIEKIPRRKPITIAVLSRAHPPSYGFTYRSGKAVQTNRSTSMCLPGSRVKVRDIRHASTPSCGKPCCTPCSAMVVGRRLIDGALC